MKKLKLTGKDIRGVGYPEGPVVSVAMRTMEKNFKHTSHEEALEILKNVLANPAEFTEDELLKPLAKLVAEEQALETLREKHPTLSDKELKQYMAGETGVLFGLNAEGVPLSTYGAGHIEDSALGQIQVAAKLPVAVAAALMPDAHHGYGLPIGGVLATKNAVIPYGVGVDIGCRMCLSIFDVQAIELKNRDKFFERELNENTLFGAGREFRTTTEHEVLDNDVFNQIPFVKNLQMKAAKQLGSSGSGNHFVEWGIVDISSEQNALNIPIGKYVALLSHSGSRGLGASIAGQYTKIAMEKTRLPAEAKHLAWLDLNTQEGMEYWLAMNLAGDYASACHHVIHKKMAKAIGQKPIAMVENHHNFAWKETWKGEEVIVHRKGATPAGAGVLGIIPGSMTAPGFIVQGKGVEGAINSASHGAGRKMSRTKAMQNVSKDELKNELRVHGVKLIGGGLDEAPQAYKDIHAVMKAQADLVDVVGLFYPRIVKMDG
ncbi:MAG TPA: RtcB family protein [Chitinophagales bacterium]|nr:RtcB family protein [Chitinophagales bacterium]